MASKVEKKTFKRKGEFIYHPESNLIIKSTKEKMVIGRFDEDGNKLGLDEKTLELCEEYGFDPDPSLLEDVKEEKGKKGTEEADEEGEEGDEGEDEEEDEEEEKEQQKKVTKEAPSKKPSKEVAKEVSSKEVTSKDVSSKDVSSKDVSSKDVSSKDVSVQELLKTFGGQLQQVIDGHVQRNSELSEQLSTLRKELEETKKKLKNVLSAMAENL